MRRHHVVMLSVALVALALVAFWFLRRASSSKPPTTTSVASKASTGSAAERSHGGSDSSSAPRHVQRLSRDQRRELGEKIAAALRRGRATASGGSTSTESAVDPIIPLERVGKALRDALEQAIPILADCYQHAGSAARQDATAMMTMFSDTELGTVIDTDELKDASGRALDHELDTCLRDAIDSLALPPLGERGKLQIQYTFRFDSQ